MDSIRVFHTGYLVLENPDIRHGRSNADFGQGFYVTPNEEFASRWAKESKGQKPLMNEYMLDLSGLKVHTFKRTEEWFRYIFRNRRSYKDELDADVVMGPIANDTLYDTLGIFTSGFLTDEQALELFLVGPEYVQIALKSDLAKEHLRFIGAREITDEEIKANKAVLEEEQNEYLTLTSEIMLAQE